MEDRLARLEDETRDMKSLLSRLEPMIIRIDATLTSTLPHLATRAEVGAIRSEINKDITDLRVEMSQKFIGVNQKLADVSVKLSDFPTRTYMWGILGVLITAYGAGLAALAVIK